jgi:hypothetical protein
MTEVAHPFKSSVLPAFTVTLCGTQHAVKVEMREYALCTHGSTLLFLIAALAVQDLGPGAVLDLNHLMAGSHTPSGRGRFDVLIPSIENNGRIAVARGSVLKQKTRGNGRHQEGSGKRVFGCRGGNGRIELSHLLRQSWLGSVEIKLSRVLDRVSTPSPFYQMAALAAAPCI